jgi:hypothetical protein
MWWLVCPWPSSACRRHVLRPLQRRHDATQTRRDSRTRPSARLPAEPGVRQPGGPWRHARRVANARRRMRASARVLRFLLTIRVPDAAPPPSRCTRRPARHRRVLLPRRCARVLAIFTDRLRGYDVPAGSRRAFWRGAGARHVGVRCCCATAGARRRRVARRAGGAERRRAAGAHPARGAGRLHAGRGVARVRHAAARLPGRLGATCRSSGRRGGDGDEALCIRCRVGAAAPRALAVGHHRHRSRHGGVPAAGQAVRVCYVRSQCVCVMPSASRA